MNYLIVNESSTDVELREAIMVLRWRQRHAVIPSTADELGVEIDELLDRLFPS